MKRRPGINCSFKNCSNPSKERNETNFGRNKQNKTDGLNYICKECARLQQQEVDPDKRKISRQKYDRKVSQKNKGRKLLSYDELRAQGITHRVCNCPQCKGRSRPIEDFTHDKDGPNTLAWRCRDFTRPYSAGKGRELRVVKWMESLLREARNSRCVRKEGFHFDLDMAWLIEQFENQAGKCFYFKVPLVPSSEKKHPQKPSLDRIDTKQGYTKENVVLCCWAANGARNVCDHATWVKFCANMFSGDWPLPLEGTSA